jgi:hypothetical protein
MSTKRRSEYTAAEWARLFPEQRFAIEQAETDAALGRNVMPVRAADGRSVAYVDKATGAAVPNVPARRIGGLV